MKNLKVSMFNKHPERVKRLLVVTDVQRGFIENGMTLADNYIAHIIPGVIELIKDFQNEDDQILFLLDTHTRNAAEFRRKVGKLPPHCIEGTEEAEIMPELKPYAEGKWILRKNNTMIYTVPEYRDSLDEMENLQEVIVVGDCTDLCVFDGALPTKKHFEQNDRLVDVIVPTDFVETFEIPSHNRKEKTNMAVNLLNQAGIETPKVYAKRRA